MFFTLMTLTMKFELSVGFQIVQHAIEHCRVHVTVARIARRVTRSVPHDVVPRVGDSLKKQQREIFGYIFFGKKENRNFPFPFDITPEMKMKVSSLKFKVVWQWPLQF
jgi:hypothetical protein